MPSKRFEKGFKETLFNYRLSTGSSCQIWQIFVKVLSEKKDKQIPRMYKVLSKLIKKSFKNTNNHHNQKMGKMLEQTFPLITCKYRR